MKFWKICCRLSSWYNQHISGANIQMNNNNNNNSGVMVIVVGNGHDDTSSCPGLG